MSDNIYERFVRPLLFQLDPECKVRIRSGLYRSFQCAVAKIQIEFHVIALGAGVFLHTQIFAKPLFSRGPAKIVKAFTGRIRGGEMRVILRIGERRPASDRGRRELGQMQH